MKRDSYPRDSAVRWPSPPSAESISFSPHNQCLSEIFHTLAHGISKLGSRGRKGMWIFYVIVISTSMNWMKYDLARLWKIFPRAWGTVRNVFNVKVFEGINH